MDTTKRKEMNLVFQTIRQTAKFLDIPEHLLRSLVARGVCPGVYSGNRFLVHVEALREYLDAESRQVKEVQA
ncbi:hypothetical protein [Hominenteromicrobium sp.]|uniref:hypothetical protein n=1 Tax=Hominenteromicrobium sp. TaxID=3073581 RepID=UPI003AB1A63B